MFAVRKQQFLGLIVASGLLVIYVVIRRLSAETEYRSVGEPKNPPTNDLHIRLKSEETVAEDEEIEMTTELGCQETCLRGLTGNPSQNSQCGVYSDLAGEHQKVVAFSFYGEWKTAYYNGIEANAQEIQDFYPGWYMRLYMDPSSLNASSSSELCSLVCKSSSRLQLCSVRNVPEFGDISAKFGMVWRFLPMTDPLVDVMMSRDLDSRFSAREVDAVNEWLNSSLPFHAMRDNPHHGTYILGGMWGARMDLGNREEYAQMMQQLIDTTSTRWSKGYDQSLLASVIWPKVKDEAVVHDSFLCESYPSKHLRPWPSRRPEENGNFVGSIGEMKIQVDCPPSCRPVHHQDWTKC